MPVMRMTTILNVVFLHKCSPLFSFGQNTSHLQVFSSVAQSCPTLWDPMNRSTPGPPVHHQLPEFTQTHAHRVGDAIQPSHPLSSPSPPAPNPSQHQGPFQWVKSFQTPPIYSIFSYSLQPVTFALSSEPSCAISFGTYIFPYPTIIFDFLKPYLHPPSLKNPTTKTPR